MTPAPARPLCIGVLAAVLVGFTILATVPAAAQPSDNLEKILRQGGARPQPKDRRADAGIHATEALPIQAEVQWGLRRETAEEEARDRHLDAFLRLSNDLGEVPRDAWAHALLLEADELDRAGQATLADKRFEQARRLSPQSPTVDFTQAAVALRRSPLNVSPAWRAVSSGWDRAWRWLGVRYALQAHIAQVLVLALGAFALILALVVLSRHLRLLAADLQRLAPRGAALLQLQLLALLLIAAPGVLLASPVASVLASLLLLAPYMRWSERIATVAALVGMALLPWAASSGDAGLSFAGSEAWRTWHASAVRCDAPCAEALGKAPGDDPLAGPKVLTAATWGLRHHKPAELGAVAAQLQPLADATAGGPLRAAARNNLGVARAALGELPAAEKLFQAAALDAPTSWAPHLNLARVYELQGRAAETDAEIKAALDLGGTAAAERSSETERTVNLWFEIMPTPPELIAATYDAQRFDGAVMAARWQPAFGRLPVLPTSQLAPAFFGAFLVFSVGGLVFRSARRCPRCGQEMFRRREGPREDVDGVCRLCHTCFGGGQMTYHERVEHESIAQRWETRARWTRRLGNVVPGLGMALRGGAVGLLAIAFISLGAGVLIAGDQRVPLPGALPGLWVDGLGGAGWALIALGALLGGGAILLGDPASPEDIRIGTSRGGPIAPRPAEPPRS